MSSRSFRKEEVQEKTVIDASGVVLGKVNDVVFSLNGAVTLIVGKEGGGEVQIPLSTVLGISDYVIVRGKATAQSLPSGTVTPCKFCGHEMASGAVLCPSCGKAQG